MSIKFNVLVNYLQYIDNMIFIFNTMQMLLHFIIRT